MEKSSIWKSNWKPEFNLWRKFLPLDFFFESLTLNVNRLFIKAIKKYEKCERREFSLKHKEFFWGDEKEKKKRKSRGRLKKHFLLNEIEGEKRERERKEEGGGKCKGKYKNEIWNFILLFKSVSSKAHFSYFEAVKK